MEFEIIPIDMISSPNVYVPLQDKQWTVLGGNKKTLYGILTVKDTLGQRRYLPAAGAVLKVIFQRADTQATPTQAAPQTITKTAMCPVPADGSLFKIDLTAGEVDLATSGTVRFELAESGDTKVWLQNWALNKKQTSQGF
jgi:hypothetical protein